jgi:hypothetical protein
MVPVRALQFRMIARLEPDHGCQECLLIAWAELAVRDVPEHPFQEIRRSGTVLDISAIHHLVADVLHHADVRLEAGARRLVLRGAVVRVLHRVVHDLVALLRPESDAFAVGGLRSRWKGHIATMFEARQDVSIAT